MRRVTPTEARRNWFRLLDEVAAGEEVVVERKGARIVLRRETPGRRHPAVPSYAGLIKPRCAERADTWGWDWSDEGLLPSERARR